MKEVLRITRGFIPFDVHNFLRNRSSGLEEMRKIEGVWSKHQIENLARSMMAETEFRDIASAGELLLRNQQGKPSLSIINPLFVDNPISIVSLAPSPDQDFTMAEEIVEVTDPAKTRTKLQFTKLLINAEQTGDLSDFLFKFWIAKEMSTVESYYLASELAARAMFGQQYEMLDENDQHATQLQLLDTGFIKRRTNMPIRFMAELWAYFLMFPTFALAKDLGKLTKGNYATLHALYNFDLVSDFFFRQDIINKNKDGEYQWIREDLNHLFSVWLEAAVNTHAAASAIV